ncbi:YlbG family protein [Paenibacillus hamazuiensis]|uniref:YlbG family protein n=1 Tax=Paenibacillus hamazuiensis TaxID=2936508 RepID=UPI00200D7624|nr:YlbG family protein [Paenibacillus hamazuiensis]
MLTQRSGFIVWVNDLKAAAKQLERFGSIHYISKKLHYVVMYTYADRVEETMKQVSRLHFVKKVERSYRNEIKTEYNSNMPDKTRFYSL